MEAIKNCSSCSFGDVVFSDNLLVTRCQQCSYDSSSNNPYPMWSELEPPCPDYHKDDPEDWFTELHAPEEDIVNHPKHYTVHPSGVECIQITEHMNFCLGNAMKYIWRAGDKHETPIEDLKKAKWYIEREIQRLEKL